MRQQQTVTLQTEDAFSSSFFTSVSIAHLNHAYCHAKAIVFRLPPMRVVTPLAHATFNDCRRFSGIENVAPTRAFLCRSALPIPFKTVLPPVKKVALPDTHIRGRRVYTRLPENDAIGFCVRRELPRKLLLGVNNQTPPVASRVQRPLGLETPISGLNAHRFDPGLTRRRGSYWPEGTTITTLAPMSVVGFRSANSFGLRASPPFKRVENRTRISPPPERLATTCCSKTDPCAVPQI